MATFRLTCNQMIQLLERYRGTEADALNLGTWFEDARHLRALGLLSYDWEVTDLGREYVKEVLGKGHIVESVVG